MHSDQNLDSSVRTLLFLENKEVQEMVSFLLESHYPILRALSYKSAQEAVEVLQSPERPDLIICSYQGTKNEVLDYLIGKNPDIHSIVCVNEKSLKLRNQPHCLLGYANFAELEKELKELVEKFLAQSQKEIKGSSLLTDYCRIRPNLLLRISPLQLDVNIRLSDHKLLKIFKKGDTFDELDLERYMIKKKIPYFYVNRNESAVLIEKFKRDIAELYKFTDQQELSIGPGMEQRETESPKPEVEKPKPEVEKPSSKPEKKESKEQVILAKKPETKSESNPPIPKEILQKTKMLSKESHQAIQSLIQQMGPTPEVQEVVKNNVRQALKVLEKSPGLSHFLKGLKHDKDKYVSSHSLALGTLACTIASQMEWNSETTYYKLSLAAHLHDITLTNEVLASIQSLGELEKRKSEFTPEEHQAFKSHTMKGSEIAKRFTEIPPDVDTIIAQHHELPDGKGFPRGLTHTRISPLASIFIVAHDLLLFVYEKGENWSVNDYLESRKNTFSTGNFKKIMKTLLKNNKLK